MLKVKPHPDYPPEEGRYIRGNDNSPVAVAIILNCDADKIPPELENLVRAEQRAVQHCLVLFKLKANNNI